MEISVAMATYEGSAYVVEQLDSILAQSTPPAEIVVCDDRSTDDTVALVRGVARRSAIPVRVVVNATRLGWRENFMRAASLCASEVIAFCDQDDIWDRRKLQTVSGAFADPGTLMVFHDATVVSADLRPVEPFSQGGDEPDDAEPLGRGPWRDVYGFTIAFRRELLPLWRYWPESIDKSVGSQRAAHDQWLLFLGSSLGGTRHLPEELTLYRQHDRNAVGVKDAFRPPPRMQRFLRYRDVVNLRLAVMERRIRTLAEIAGDDERFGRAASVALPVHEAHRDRLEAQTGVYNSPSLRARIRSFRDLLAGGAYARGAWTLGAAQAFDDGAATLLGPAAIARVRRVDARAAERRARRATTSRAARQSQSP